MGKWVSAILVMFATIVVAALQGLFWAWALNSHDLEVLMSFLGGMCIGVLGFGLSKVAWHVAREREFRRYYR